MPAIGTDISYGQWNQGGADEYETGAAAACLTKVFYISGFTVTKRKTGIRAQGGTALKNMAAPCTTTATLAMSVIFKGESDLWPELFNKRYTIPVSAYTSSYSYSSNGVTGSLPIYTFYKPTTSITYFSPTRKFYFTLNNIGVCIPKEFFDISADLPNLPLPTESGTTPTYKTYFDAPHVTSENLQHLIATKKTPTSFYFKSFEWSSGYSYCYNSLSQTTTSYQDPFYYIGKEKTTALQKHFDDDCLGIVPNFSFLASDYCYEIENGNLYFREMTLVPSDPELSDIMGIESITCKLTNSL